MIKKSTMENLLPCTLAWRARHEETNIGRKALGSSNGLAYRHSFRGRDSCGLARYLGAIGPTYGGKIGATKALVRSWKFQVPALGIAGTLLSFGLAGAFFAVLKWPLATQFAKIQAFIHRCSGLSPGKLPCQITLCCSLFAIAAPALVFGTTAILATHLIRARRKEARRSAETKRPTKTVHVSTTDQFGNRLHAQLTEEQLKFWEENRILPLGVSWRTEKKKK